MEDFLTAMRLHVFLEETAVAYDLMGPLRRYLEDEIPLRETHEALMAECLHSNTVHAHDLGMAAEKINDIREKANEHDRKYREHTKKMKKCLIAVNKLDLPALLQETYLGSETQGTDRA